jgi:hypothetical protein
MKTVLPNYNINLSLKTIRISQLFSRSSKSEPPPLSEKSDSNCHFVCDCGENYIGMCLRVVCYDQGCKKDGDSKGRDRSPGEGWEGMGIETEVIAIPIYPLCFPRLSPSIPHSIPFLNISEIYFSEI